MSQTGQFKWLRALGVVSFVVGLLVSSASAQGLSATITSKAIPPKATVYVFLAEGCPICEQSTPELKRLHKLYAPQGVAFCGVFPNEFSDSATVHAFKKTFSLPFDVRLDTAHVLVQQLGATVTPQAFVVLPSGAIAYKGRIDNMFVGLGKRRSVVTIHDVEVALNRVLNSKSLPQQAIETTAFGCVIERRSSDSSSDDFNAASSVIITQKKD